jgi:hypothetical protein
MRLASWIRHNPIHHCLNKLVPSGVSPLMSGIGAVNSLYPMGLI